MLPPLLIVDDDPLIRDSLAYVLGRDYEVRVASNRADAVSAFTRSPTPAAALIDLGLPPRPHSPDEGFALISDLLSQAPAARIIVLSGQSDEASARHARVLGAVEFAAKPAKPEYLRQLIERVIAYKDAPLPADGLLGDSEVVRKLKHQVRQFADSPFPVLIEGESGTGKELVANGLHKLSRRKSAPYLALNCAAIAPNLVEASLFGHSKGAFTGAGSGRAGYFEDAAGGTLLLDEVGELPLDVQPKLLRVLENGEFQRIGETALRKSSARIIAATNRDLRKEVQAGRFRADLFHRLSVLSISVPPLRERESDALLLLRHFVDDYARQSGVAPPRLSVESEARLLRYSFPGNVRELRNIAIRLCTKHPSNAVGLPELEAEFDLSGEGTGNAGGQAPTGVAIDNVAATRMEEIRAGTDFNLEARLREIEADYLDAALALAGGNLSQAAKLLGLSRTTLYSRLAVVARHRDKPAAGAGDTP